MTETWIGDHPNDGREYDCQCARCGSSLDFERCERCDDDGFVDHDCGEDCCACLYPEPNVVCDECYGRGHFPRCLSGYKWCDEHPRPGRETISPSTPEWFLVEPVEDSR